jgi:hypothetical protein
MPSNILTPDGETLRDPGQVERALAEMWKQAGAAATGDARQPAASRVCLANLIVVCAADRWDERLEVLGELSPLYPTRTIALLVQEQCTPGPEVVRASVSALCHVPQPGQPQVCCEQIVLRASRAQADDLHRTVLPLLESDVPVMVWWTLDPLPCGELLGSLAHESRRFIMDAGLLGTSYLPGIDSPAVRDLGWYRIHRWRELIASMFDECGEAPLRTIEEMVVEAGQPLTEGLEAAVWLIAFFGGQLGWQMSESASPAPVKADSPTRTAPTSSAGSARSSSAIEFTESGSDEIASFVFEHGGRTVGVRIRRTAGEGLIGLSVRSNGNAFEARRDREELRIIVHEEHVCRVPRVVHLPRRRRSEALAAALAGRAVDAAFERARSLAAGMAQSLLSLHA